MLIAGLAIVFAGLLGGDAKLDAQVRSVVRELRVKPVSMPASSLRKLTHRGDATRELIRGLRADGVIACEVIKVRGARSLRIVIYEGDGRLKTFSEIPLGPRGLAASDVAVLLSNLKADVTAMRATEPEPDDTIVVDDDDDNPLAPRRPARAKTGADPIALAAADDADAPDELAVTTTTRTSSSATSARALRIGAAAGVGIASRSFTPEPSQVLPYSASPVPTLVVDVTAQLTRRLGVAAGLERTLQLTTAMGDGSSAPTTISRWEAAATYTVATLGALQLAPRLGGGRRSFVIDSTDPARSPDSEYNYLVAGLTASARLGSRTTVRVAAAFEPVLFGGGPTEMSLGDASRWAIDLGAAVEVRAATHVFMRASAHYQRFQWSWDMPAEPSDAGAVDRYPSGSLALGFDY